MELKSPRRTHPMVRSFVLIVLLFALGTVGYMFIGGHGTTALDALYMTVITLTTVGYGEVVVLDNSPGGRIFTMLLMLGGFGVLGYFFSNMTALVVGGTLNKFLWRRKMERMIDGMSGHYVVCGAGETGRHMVRELIETQRDFVVIEGSQDRIDVLYEELDKEFPAIAGDATEDEALAAAAVDRAAGLIACVSSDKDNLMVTISARMMNADLRIVARCIDEKVAAKLKTAGADAIVSPNMIGGMRMVSELIRPTVVSFLDVMLRDKQRRLRVEEVVIQPGSRLVGKSVAQVHDETDDDMLVLALYEGDGTTWTYNPKPHTTLEAGMTLVFLSGPDTRAEVTAVARGHL